MTNPNDDLFLDEDDHDYDTEPTGAADMEQAEYHRRRIRQYRQQEADLMATFDAEIKRLVDRKRLVCAPLDDRASWHETALEMWHRAAFAKGEVGETVKLPSGNSELRRIPLKIEVDDEAFQAFLADDEESMGVLYPVPEPVARKLDRKALKPYATAVTKNPEEGQTVVYVNPDGERIPGVTARFEGRRWQKGGKS